jgi:hypothetical protein
MVFWVVVSYRSESLTFWRNIMAPSSGLLSKPSKKPMEAGSKLSLLS